MCVCAHNQRHLIFTFDEKFKSFFFFFLQKNQDTATIDVIFFNILDEGYTSGRLLTYRKKEETPF
jgi:hypothetical protein